MMKQRMKLLTAGLAVLLAAALIGCAEPATIGAAPSVPPGVTPEITQPPTIQVTEPPAPTATSGGSSGSVVVGSSVEVSPVTAGPTSSPTDVPPAPGGNDTGDTIRITMADNGKTITLHVGDEFLLYLEGNVDQPERVWSLDISNQDVFRRVMGIMVIKGAQGLFKANQPGQSTLSAVGDLPCRQAQPPCMAPSLAFQVTIVVQ